MPARHLIRRATILGTARADQAPIYVDSDDNIVKLVPAGSGTTEVQIIDASSAQTLTNKTITAPIFTAPAAGTTGIVIAKTIVFTEDATSLTHTGTVALPAGSTLLDVLVTNKALWTATGSVTFKLGDTADSTGYFTGFDMKATDLVLGETLSISGSTNNWGGKNGTYLVAATGRRGPAATNFGYYYDAGSNIVATITVVTPATTVGRTFVTVYYSVGNFVTPTLA